MRHCLCCVEPGIWCAISCALFGIGYAGRFMTEEFKAYRLQLIAEAVENVRRERELNQQMSEDFSLEEASYDD